MAAVARVLTASVRACAVPMAVRTMATAASTSPAVPHVDWSLIRSKMQTEEGKAEADKARDAFNRRLAAAQAATAPADIDWAFYKSKLPDIDIDALKKDYDAFLAAIPAQAYDESKDKAVHEGKESAWTGFARYCESRISELAKLETEQKDHKLHRWYRRARLWQRFPGLYESLHNKARGTWDNEMWGNYIAYKARLTAVPWDPTVGDLDEGKRKEAAADFASKSGIPLEQVAAAAGEKKATA